MSQVTDEQILQQQDAIRNEVNSTSPYVAAKVPLEDLLQEFRNHAIYTEKTKVCHSVPLSRSLLEGKNPFSRSYPFSQSLMDDFHWIRRIRRDGNCFFRAFGFALLEYLHAAPDAVARKGKKTLANPFVNGVSKPSASHSD